MEDLKNLKESLLGEWQELRDTIDQVFYYLEEEDYQRKGSQENSWTLAEVLFHINLLNRHFLSQISDLKPEMKEVKKLPKSFYAKMLLPTMPAATKGKSKKNYKTPRSTDPKHWVAKGHAIVPKVVFADLLADLDELKAYINKIEEGNFARLKLKGIIKVFKLYVHEALLIMIRHSRRHILQAENILAGK